MVCISVCIAAYNAEKFINDCLRSVASQTVQPHEIVIVDDGSEVPLEIAAEILGLFRSCRVRVIRTENNGPYAARRHAIEQATGDAVVCVDSDDELVDSHALEKIVQGFDAGAEIVLYNATTSKDNQSNSLDYKNLGSGGFVDKTTVWHELICGETLNSLCCKAFRKKCYLRHPGESDPRLLVSEDRLQSAEIIESAESIFLIDEPLYFYRSNSNSTINSVYNPDYYHQACYVEGKLLHKIAGNEALVSEWAAFFLQYILACILRYSRDYADCTFKLKKKFYMSAVSEDVTRKALQYLDDAQMVLCDSIRIRMLASQKYRSLELSMLPWRLRDRLCTYFAK